MRRPGATAGEAARHVRPRGRRPAGSAGSPRCGLHPTLAAARGMIISCFNLMCLNFLVLISPIFCFRNFVHNVSKFLYRTYA
uniref:Uncharacterized protein n=1 Tax=Setaria italica TaxID=4555 RepID=K3Y0H1_SETIT